jgi:hypothetical protein
MDYLVPCIEIFSVAILAFAGIALTKPYHARWQAFWQSPVMQWLIAIGMAVGISLIMTGVIFAPNSDGHPGHDLAGTNLFAQMLGAMLIFCTVLCTYAFFFRKTRIRGILVLVSALLVIGWGMMLHFSRGF